MHALDNSGNVRLYYIKEWRAGILRIENENVRITKQKGVKASMNVEDIPVPAMAAIRVSKEGKSALFETTIIQTTDNKYIYTMPVRVDDKLVNFEAKGLFKEIKIEFCLLYTSDAADD